MSKVGHVCAPHLPAAWVSPKRASAAARRTPRDRVTAVGRGRTTATTTATTATTNKPYLTGGVWLTQLQTLRILDRIAGTVGVVAAAAFRFRCGDASSPHLEAVRAGSPLRIGGFPTGRLIRVHPR